MTLKMTGIDQLLLFIKRAEELCATHLMQTGLKPDMSISHSQKDGTTYQLNEPDEDDLRSFLLTYRQFISPNEPVFINKIYNLCQTHVTNPDGRAFLAKARKHWNDLQKNNNLRLVYMGEALAPSEIQDLWINGYYFHNDTAKKARLEKLSNGFQIIFRHQFLAFVTEAARHILYVAGQLKYAFESGEIKDRNDKGMHNVAAGRSKS